MAVKNSAEEGLKSRVEEYWTYRVKKILDKSYEIEYPLYRKKISFDVYSRGLRRRDAVIEDYEILEIKEGADNKAEVKLRIKVKVLLRNMGRVLSAKTVITDDWINVNGVWYHHVK